MKKNIKKIAVLTSGGDAPGMNPALISIIENANKKHMDLYLISEGYQGLFNNQIKHVSEYKNYDKYINKGGTFLYTSRFVDFKNVDIQKQAKHNLDVLGITHLIVIGGEGSYKGANALSKLGVKIIAIPATIDNDIASSEYAIGFDTSLRAITENVERIRDTMISHNRNAIVEVMGNHCGDLALYSAKKIKADLVATNNQKVTFTQIAKSFAMKNKKGKRGLIAIISEKMFDVHDLAKKITEKNGVITKGVILSYIQRGGIPTKKEVRNATRFGKFAIELIDKNSNNFAVGLKDNKLVKTQISKAVLMKKELSNQEKEIFTKINKFN